jgi:hypothetical protein
VNVLELIITPDIASERAFASLAELRDRLKPLPAVALPAACRQG